MKYLNKKIKNLLFFGLPILGVQSAAVNVVCELARKNPKNYLSLAPVFFKLMTTSTNNWMLIKIIKLVSCFPHFFYTHLFYFTSKKIQLSSLVSFQPIIGRKITTPLLKIITR